MSLQIGGHSTRKHATRPTKTPYTPFGNTADIPLVSNNMFMDTPNPFTATPIEPAIDFNPYAGLTDDNKYTHTPAELPQVVMGNPYAGITAVDEVVPQEANYGAVSEGGTKGYEGYRSKIYTDTTGNATIGYGHKLTAAEIKSGKYANGITKEQGEALYAKDRKSHTDAFYKKEPWAKNLSASQREALEDMAFNMGSGFLDKFSKNRALMQQGDFHTASNSFSNSLYARQVGKRAHDNARKLRY